MSVVPPEAPVRRGFFSRRPGDVRSAAIPQPGSSVSREVTGLPARHGGTSFSILGREPSVAFATWDLPNGVGEGWSVEIRCEGVSAEPQVFRFPAQVHSAYLRGLAAGGRYVVRASLRSPEGAVRALVPPAAELALPPNEAGEGEVRFARAPWSPGALSSGTPPVQITPAPAVAGALPTSRGATAPGTLPATSPGTSPAPGLSSGAALRLPTSPGAR